MRILQIIETGGPGGAETVYSMLSRGLRDRGHDVHCLVGEGTWLPGELRERGFQPYLRENGGSFDVALLRQIVLLIRRHNVELVHAHLFDAAVYAGVAAAWCGVPCVTTLHGQVDVNRRGLAQRVKASALRYGSKAVVAVSNSLRTDLQPALHIPAERFHVVYNGVEQLHSEPPQRLLQPTSQVSSQAFRLIAVGNIRPAKDYPNLLRAVHHLVQRGVAVHLDIVGQPDGQGLFESLQALLHQLGITANVTFHGFVANPRVLLEQAQAFVLASSQEGFSLATIEAMLAGTPVVATRSGGPEEIIADEETGLLVPVGNHEALANAIERLMNEVGKASALAVAAEQSARTRFSVTAMLDRYEQIFADVRS
ncbi:glycosyltransferase family 4 protein [Gemmatimonas sp.]